RVVAGARGCDCGKEGFRVVWQRRSQIVEVALDGSLTLIADRSDTHLDRRAGQRVRHLFRKELLKALAITPEPAEGDQLVGSDLETSDTFEDIRCPAGLTELTIVDDVQSDGQLLADHLGHCFT